MATLQAVILLMYQQALPLYRFVANFLQAPEILWLKNCPIYVQVASQMMVCIAACLCDRHTKYCSTRAESAGMLQSESGADGRFCLIISAFCSFFGPPSRPFDISTGGPLLNQG